MAKNEIKNTPFEVFTLIELLIYLSRFNVLSKNNLKIMIDPTGKGEMISAETAITFLEDFLNSLSNPESAAYGHLFGLDKVQNLMSFIATYNSSKDPDDKIAGIRVYNCLDEARGTSDKRDVFLIPVLKNGNDLYDIHNVSLVEAEGILGKPVPCPNFCAVDD